MYNTMRDEMMVRTGKKVPDRKSQTEKEGNYMSENEIIKKIEQNATMRSKTKPRENKWVKFEFSHPGVWVKLIN